MHCAPVLELPPHPRQHVCWDGRVCRLRAIQEDELPYLARQQMIRSTDPGLHILLTRMREQKWRVWL
jgi:hypothetical protein